MKRWEYFIIWNNKEMDERQKALNNVGSYGWELVSVIEKKQGFFQGYEYTFKREKAEE